MMPQLETQPKCFHLLHFDSTRNNMGLLRRNVLLRWMALVVCGLWLTLVLPGVAQLQTLVMGTEADHGPFAFHHAADGDPDKIVGFDIDVARLTHGG